MKQDLKMKFVKPLAKLLVIMGLMSTILTDGYSDGTEHDTENAIQEIEDHLKAIENDNSLPSSEEQSAYRKHFESHNNSLDSISDFGYGKEGTGKHSSPGSHFGSHSKHSEHEHEDHHHEHEGHGGKIFK